MLLLEDPEELEASPMSGRVVPGTVDKSEVRSGVS